MSKRVKPYWFPPSLLFRQLASSVEFALALGWRNYPRWFFKYGLKTAPVSAGAIGMGCIGFPNHPVWEVTSRCNLECKHCHVGSGDIGYECDLDTAYRTLDQLAELDEFRMIAFTGGEPLVHPKIIDILAYSHEKGFVNVVATNATLIDEKIADDLKRTGVAGIAVSIDSCYHDVHNEVRQNKEALDLALTGLQNARDRGILIQANITAMEFNADHIEEVLRFADGLGSGIGLLYQLVPVGRGAEIGDKRLRKEANRILLAKLAETQADIGTLFEPVASPQYWPYLFEANSKNGYLLKAAEGGFHGCSAGRGLLYIRADGEMLPCPFLQVSAGNAYTGDLVEIWRNGEVFRKLRDRDNLKGSCGECKYRNICGGCRGKAHAISGDYLAEDPDCFVKDMMEGE